MRTAVAVVATLLPLAAAAIAHAEEGASAPKLSAQEILARMDALNNAYADQVMQLALTVKDVDGAKKTYEFTMYQKGDTKRMMQFTSGEMKGMATLVEDRNSVYVYLPGFKKVRRVTANTMSQGFAGSDMSNDDMAITAWGKGFVPVLDKEDETSWWLVLTPKPDEKTEYGKVIHRVTKDGYVQQETHYFSKSGELVKKMINTELTDWGGGVKRFKIVTVTDPRTGHQTIIETKTFKVNQGLKDDLFTVRQLQWGK